jgi:hypothetical protein
MPESLTMTVEGTIAHHWSLAHWSLLFAMLLLIALCSLGEAALVAANRGRVRALLRSASSHFPSPVPPLIPLPVPPLVPRPITRWRFGNSCTIGRTCPAY